MSFYHLGFIFFLSCLRLCCRRIRRNAIRVRTCCSTRACRFRSPQVAGSGISVCACATVTGKMQKKCCNRNKYELSLFYRNTASNFKQFAINGSDFGHSRARTILIPALLRSTYKHTLNCLTLYRRLSYVAPGNQVTLKSYWIID